MEIVSLYRQLVQSCKTREESFLYFEDAIKLLKSCPNIEKSIPDHEIIFLTRDSWNNGVYYYK